MAGDDDRKFEEPPPNFAVLREGELHEGGRMDRWIARGVISGRSIIRDGYTSHSAACRSAWIVWDDARRFDEEIEVTDITQVDRVVAEALARKHAAKRERLAERAEQTMPERYTVQRDTWDHMTGELLAQFLSNAGSIRKAAKALDIPRSTLGAWVCRHRERGTWPL